MKAIRVYTSVIFGLLLIGIHSTALAQETDTYNLDETYSISENGTIELSSNDAGLVEVRGSDRNNVRLIVTYRLEVRGVSIGKNDKFEMEVTERDGNLIVREKSRENLGINIGSSTKKYSITILAPESVNLDFTGDDDTYEISDINGSIRIDSDDSDISLRDCEGDEFHFDFDDGEVVMGEGRGTLDMEYDDGEADIRNGEFTNVNVDMDDGDFNLSTTLADDGAYSFSSDDGNIDLTIIGGGGNFRIELDDVRVSADSDFVEVQRNENYTEYRLDGGTANVHIETDDGDIRLFTQ